MGLSTWNVHRTLEAAAYGTVFSLDRTYRYTLWRRLAEHSSAPSIAFIGLNPSTADETVDDPTIRRCMGFARRWGYSRMCMLNLFAFRATDPKVMRAKAYPIGPDNDAFIEAIVASVPTVVLCWGAHGEHRNREAEVIKLLEGCAGTDVYTLGLTKAGHPKHPLYLRADTERLPWI